MRYEGAQVARVDATGMTIYAKTPKQGFVTIPLESLTSDIQQEIQYITVAQRAATAQKVAQEKAAKEKEEAEAAVLKMAKEKEEAEVAAQRAAKEKEEKYFAAVKAAKEKDEIEQKAAKEKSDSAEAKAKENYKSLPATQKTADSFLGLTKGKLIELLGNPVSVKSGRNKEDGNYEMICYDEAKNVNTFFVIWANEGFVTSGMFKGIWIKNPTDFTPQEVAKGMRDFQKKQEEKQKIRSSLIELLKRAAEVNR
ncbi:MAG: hypothetical protein WCK17_11020 [Verrucomicrobiota bacterium]